ncbi:pyocin knob domain-containing protein [Providencia huaxiensis]|uniref:pyocin knob domain-containing protein n=1 Tax=Providencia huaxiensis TaxID=2027290 RepID=UPI0034DD294A
MYNIGTVTTTANSPKITGTGTRWKDNTTLVSVGQIVLIENGSTLIINCIDSIESNTTLTLGFPVSVKLTNVKYRILTTMIDSISDGVNKATAQVIASEIFTDIFTELMTGTGTLDFELPNGQKVKLRTENEKDKLLDGKLDKTGGEVSGNLSVTGTNFTVGKDASMLQFKAGALVPKPFINYRTDSTWYQHYFQDKTGTLMHVRDFGIGAIASVAATAPTVGDMNSLETSGFYGASGAGSLNAFNQTSPCISAARNGGGSGTGMVLQIQAKANGSIGTRFRSENVWSAWIENYNVTNTTKDTNGNLKAASPVVKLFADNIELNDESEGVEMEHLGVGHYLIKGVVGFNADGAWGINNGFVIPQDHNGKNMVLIDYEVRPDGDIEVFVFHQQDEDMPERFQNKRIKHFDEEGVPVYFENYEPCDVPESRWIDMRVEMPPNSLYNQKQAEAERLAKLEAERLAQEEAKRAAEEAERAEQEAAERKQYVLGDNDALL